MIASWYASVFFPVSVSVRSDHRKDGTCVLINVRWPVAQSLVAKNDSSQTFLHVNTSHAH